VSFSNYISPAGHRRLAYELVRLTTVERPRVVQEVSEAAAQGDRSENAEYIYGKKRLREIDGRIRRLTRRLDKAVVVEPGAARRDIVFFGAIVDIEDEDGNRKRYHLVGEDETAPEEGRISWQSPVGRALLKRRVGDVATVRRPAGDVELEIVAIRYET
jgi:transcription elongation factor GreB